LRRSVLGVVKIKRGDVFYVVLVGIFIVLFIVAIIMAIVSAGMSLKNATNAMEAQGFTVTQGSEVW
jgi:hypothetical protein